MKGNRIWQLGAAAGEGQVKELQTISEKIGRILTV